MITAVGDSLGDRMKLHESVYARHLTPNVPIVVRVDGRAFHTFTRGCDKPFDSQIMSAMDNATIKVFQDMSGCVVAYTQSDEATFILRDDQTLVTQQWFGGDHSKIVSIAAAEFTAWFNYYYDGGRTDRPATFDARAFSIPVHEIPNILLWRMRDWERNSLQMFARSHFSTKELHGKNHAAIVEMLTNIGESWDRCSKREKYGLLVEGVFAHEQRWTYQELASLLDVE